MLKVFLRKKIGTRIAHGHLWIFKNEIGDIEGDLRQGDIVNVYSSNGAFVGKGYYNPYSQLTIRLLTRDINEDIGEVFFLNKIKAAKAYRERLGYTDNYRLIHSEADNLPGLIIDKFDQYFVMQIATYGMERWKNAIVNALKTLYNPKGIYERNDINQRLKEGLQLQKGFLSPPFDTKILIKENDLQFKVDIENGTKTGYFLDQLHCKLLLQNRVHQAEVLDVFGNTGSLMLYAAKYGAKQILGIEENIHNYNLALENIARNGFIENCKIELGNSFDKLHKLEKQNEIFDVVILNPPPFATNSKQKDKALSAYKELNLRALKLLRKGGYLLTISNSNIITENDLKQTILDAALDANKRIVQIAQSTQSNDHPVLWQIPETKYLKCFLLMVQ